MTQDGDCTIWGTPARYSSTARDGINLDSPRAGGRYFISRSAEVNLKNWEEFEKILLTNWLIEQHRLGVQCPEITSATLEKIIICQPLSVHQRADNLLRYLSEKSHLIGDIVELFHKTEMYSESQIPENLNYFLFLAWTSSLQLSEILSLIEFCKEKNWVESITDTANSPLVGIVYKLKLKAGGYARLADLDNVNTDSQKCFVAMWFDPCMAQAYDDGILPAIKDSGYYPVRIDQKEHIDKIDDQIVAEIRRSRFLIADFTSKPDMPRGGVYYEAGFAQGLNIPVIWTCREDQIDNVHFDTRQFNHIVWKTPDELCQKLTARIGAVIGDGPLKMVVNNHDSGNSSE